MNMNDDPTLVGDRWVWPDGTSLPRLRGGIDDGGDDPGDDLDEPLDDPDDDLGGDDAPPGGDSPPPPEGAEPDVDDPKTWTREYVSGLRAEAAKHRTASERYQSAFEGIQDDDQAVLLDLARQYRDDPEAFARSVVQIAAAYGSDDSKPAPAAQQKPDDKNRPLTRADLEAWEKQKAEAARQEQVTKDVAALQSQAEKLGYKAGSRDYVALMHEAYHNQGGDLDKAHAAIEADKQKLIDDFVAGKRTKAAGAPRVPANGGPPNDSKPPPSMYLEGTMKINPEWQKAVRGG